LGFLGHEGGCHESGRDRRDAVSMTMHLGYALSSAIFLALFLVTAAVQLSSRAFHPTLRAGRQEKPI
jgi:uncharacterized membrane-anchored protein